MQCAVKPITHEARLRGTTRQGRTVSKAVTHETLIAYDVTGSQ